MISRSAIATLPEGAAVSFATILPPPSMTSSAPGDFAAWTSRLFARRLRFSLSSFAAFLAKS